MTSRFSLCCFLVRMHPYVTMYPNYYPYDDDDDDNNNNNNNNNNDNDKKAWSAGRWGGGGGENRVWDLGEPRKLTRAPLVCVASVSNRVNFIFALMMNSLGTLATQAMRLERPILMGKPTVFAVYLKTQTLEFVPSIAIRAKILPYQTLLLHIESWEKVTVYDSRWDLQLKNSAQNS